MLVGGPGGEPFKPPSNDGLRLALIKLKCSAADKISRLALATSSLRPVTTKTGSSPRTGVLMYVFVFARSALILHPKKNQKNLHENVFCGYNFGVSSIPMHNALSATKFQTNTFPAWNPSNAHFHNPLENAEGTTPTGRRNAIATELYYKKGWRAVNMRMA